MKKQRRRWHEKEYMFLGRKFRPYISDTLSSGLPKICDKYEEKLLKWCAIAGSNRGHFD